MNKNSYTDLHLCNVCNTWTYNYPRCHNRRVIIDSWQIDNAIADSHRAHVQHVIERKNEIISKLFERVIQLRIELDEREVE